MSSIYENAANYRNAMHFNDCRQQIIHSQQTTNGHNVESLSFIFIIYLLTCFIESQYNTIFYLLKQQLRMHSTLGKFVNTYHALLNLPCNLWKWFTAHSARERNRLVLDSSFVDQTFGEYRKYCLFYDH